MNALDNCIENKRGVFSNSPSSLLRESYTYFTTIKHVRCTIVRWGYIDAGRVPRIECRKEILFRFNGYHLINEMTIAGVPLIFLEGAFI
jgi:hypothetical protein